MKKIINSLVVTGFISLNAEYCATGEFQGNVCKSHIVFESCKNVQIDAVSDNSGKLFEVKRCWDSVDEFKVLKNKSLCWVYTKAKDLGLFGYAVDAINLPDFLHKNSNGKYEKVSPDYLVFECQEK